MKGKKIVSTLLAIAMLASYAPSIQAFGAASSEPEQIQPINAFANSEQDDNGVHRLAVYAIDGDEETRWANEWRGMTSEQMNHAWLTVDLGAVYDLSKIEILWEGESEFSSTGAWAKKYEIQVSDDNEHFKTICRNNNGRYDPVPENGTRDAESFRVSGQGRYIRMQSLEEGKVSSGSSIREFRVWGTPTGTDAAGDYANILNTVDNKFSDMGAWFGFRLPSGDDTGKLGGFAGPTVILDSGFNTLADSIGKWQVTNQDGTTYDLSKSVLTATAYPGKLVQSYELDDFILHLNLIFASDRTALIETTVENKTDQALELQLKQVGSLRMGTLQAIEDGVSIAVREPTHYDIRFGRPVEITADGTSYEAALDLTVPAQGSESIYQTQSYTFDAEEAEAEESKVADMLQNSASYFEENQARWDGYLEKIKTADVEQRYKNAATKAVITLIGNWRSAAGQMPYGAIQPFGDTSVGFWAWDSWKHAVATSRFNPDLAKEELRAQFAFQIQEDDANRPWDAGVICDLFRDTGIGNDRDTKPPLAAWAVYNYYQQTGDEAFIAEMYPKLVAYHEWWYKNRDIDQNGIAEYGAMVHRDHYQYDSSGNIQYDENGEALFNTGMVLQAAAWESGMDNATRFDIEGYGPDDIGVQIYRVKNDDGQTIGYTLNQESVDLNAYLYAEKCYLNAMAEMLGKTEEAAQYEAEAEQVRNYVNENMFDVETGFYYDLQTNEDGSVKKLLVNRGKGTEGWIPLWANMAMPAQAEAVIDNMLDENQFYTPMPFPTAARDNPKYSPTAYWRGPVWMDQAMFAVEAMHNYGRDEEAVESAYRLFDNAKGLLGDEPINENYNPETGDRLNATNFGWSSAAFYNLFQNTLSGANETTSQTILSQPENTDEIVQELDKAAAERLSKSIDEIIVTRPDQTEQLLALQEKYESLPEEAQDLIDPEKIETLTEMIGLAQRIQEEKAQVWIKDKSQNGYDIDITELTNKKDIKIIKDEEKEYALKGWFPVNVKDADAKFNELLSGTENSFTIETTLKIGESSSFGYLAGNGDRSVGFRTEAVGGGYRLYFYICHNGGWQGVSSDVISTEAIKNWLRVAAVFDADTDQLRLYVEDQSYTTDGVTGIDRSEHGFSVGLGEFDNAEVDDHRNTHTFYNFRIYDKALTFEEFQSQSITSEDEHVQLWYDFSELDYDDPEGPEPTEDTIVIRYNGRNASLAVNGEEQTIADLLGVYTVPATEEALTLEFTPMQGREFAGVQVNGADVEESAFEADSFVVEIPAEDAAKGLENTYTFTVVDKQNLRTTIEIAEGRADEAAEAVESVQEKYEAALQAAKDVEAKKTATQDDINTAWSDLIDALHYLSFVAGDKSQLDIPMEIADSINRDLFTPDSLKALDEAYAAAEDLLDDEEVLEADITAAVDALYDAIYGLVYRADITELEALVLKGDSIVANADQYIQNDAWTSFETSLEEAKTVLANENATQDAVDTAAEDLAAAISALRLIPDKDALEALIGEAEAINTNKYTAKSVATMKAALSTAKAVLNDAEATEEEVADAVEALENSIDGLVEKNTSTGSKNSGSTSANVGNAYGAAGVVSASQSVAANAYVVSDTTVNFTLKRGSAYCFKMTVVNGNAMTPGFTAGNGEVLKTQFVAKVGNDYYYRVYATGTPGQSTGVYTTLPGNAPVKHCAVTIG